MIKNCYIFVVLGLLLSNCSKKGEITISHENLAYFDKVNLEDSFEIHLIEGNTFSIRIEGSEGVVEDVEYTIEDSVLSLSNTGGFKWLSPTKNRIRVYITSAPLKLVVAKQTCFITTDTPITSEEFGIEFHSKANEADLELNGNVFYYWNNFQCGGKLTLRGNTNVLKIWNFAIVTVDASILIATDAIIENSSTGDCTVNVENRLDYAIKGDGNIYLYGNPSEINQTEITSATGNLIQY